jgi:hypothetical protein
MGEHAGERDLAWIVAVCGSQRAEPEIEAFFARNPHLTGTDGATGFARSRSRRAPQITICEGIAASGISM